MRAGVLSIRLWPDSIVRLLEATSESEDQMEGGFFLDVVVGEGSAVFELLSGEDESLLIWWDTFLILDLSLDVFN